MYHAASGKLGRPWPEATAVNPGSTHSDEQVAERANPDERAIAERKGGYAMWTRVLLLLALLTVVIPLVLLLGVNLGTAWVQQAVLP